MKLTVYARVTNHVVKLKINTLNMEACSKCDCDSIEVFDGPDVYSTRLGKFCSGSWSLTSSAQYLFVMFTSDSARTGNAFTVTYTTERKGIWDLKSFLHHDWRTSKTMLRFRTRLLKTRVHCLQILNTYHLKFIPDYFICGKLVFCKFQIFAVSSLFNKTILSQVTSCSPFFYHPFLPL